MKQLKLFKPWINLKMIKIQKFLISLLILTIDRSSNTKKLKKSIKERWKKRIDQKIMSKSYFKWISMKKMKREDKEQKKSKNLNSSKKSTKERKVKDNILITLKLYKQNKGYSKRIPLIQA